MSFDGVDKLRRALRREARYIIFEKTLADLKKRVEELQATVEAYKQFKDCLVEELVGKEAEVQRLKQIILEVGL